MCKAAGSRKEEAVWEGGQPLPGHEGSAVTAYALDWQVTKSDSASGKSYLKESCLTWWFPNPFDLYFTLIFVTQWDPRIFDSLSVQCCF